MNKRAEKFKALDNRVSANDVYQKRDGVGSAVHFVENQPGAISQRRIQEMVDNTPRARQIKAIQEVANHNSGIVQRALSEEEQADKLRVLKDYIQITSPAELSEEFGEYPNTKEKYINLIVKKIKENKNGAYSLKAKKDMTEDAEDDDWDDVRGFNRITLSQAVNATYRDDMSLKSADRLIGQTDEEFDRHDCVWAAVTYGLGEENSLDQERRLAARYKSKAGEVDDAILYRIMQKLSWEFIGQGAFPDMFPPLRPGTATVENIKGRYDGRYIISEDKNAQGTKGHVLAVDVKDTDDGNFERAPLGYRRDITLTDRQYERQNRFKARTGLPTYTVYVWKVS